MGLEPLLAVLKADFAQTNALIHSATDLLSSTYLGLTPWRCSLPMSWLWDKISTDKMSIFFFFGKSNFIFRVIVKIHRKLTVSFVQK